MIDTRFDTSIDLRGEIENYRQVALIKYYKMLLEIDPKKDRLTLLAVLRCIDKLERHSQERKRPRCDRKKMQADGTLAWHYQKRNQLFRKAGLYDIESTQYLVDHEEIFDTPEEREERERFEACRREALRKQEERKNEENEKAASETASTPENREEKESDSYERKPGDTSESLENGFGNREKNLTNHIDTPEYRPNPLSPLSGNIWCETYVRTPIGEPNPGFHPASFGCNRREKNKIFHSPNTHLNPLYPIFLWNTGQRHISTPKKTIKNNQGSVDN